MFLSSWARIDSCTLDTGARQRFLFAHERLQQGNCRIAFVSGQARPACLPAFVRHRQRTQRAVPVRRHPTRRTNEFWQTDFTCLQVVGWGCYDLSRVRDDYMRAIHRPDGPDVDARRRRDGDVGPSLATTGIDRVRVVHRPRLLSESGPCYVLRELAAYRRDLRTRTYPRPPYHPMTQGKIERYHRR